MKKNRELWIKVKANDELDEVFVRASAIETVGIYFKDTQHAVMIHLTSGCVYELESFYTQKEAEDCRTEFLRLMAYPKKFMVVSAK